MVYRMKNEMMTIRIDLPSLFISGIRKDYEKVEGIRLACSCSWWDFTPNEGTLETRKTLIKMFNTVAVQCPICGGPIYGNSKSESE